MFVFFSTHDEKQVTSSCLDIEVVFSSYDENIGAEGQVHRRWLLLSCSRCTIIFQYKYCIF